MTDPATNFSKLAGQRNGLADRRIRAFLDGETDGHDVLQALYGEPLGEPIPRRLRDVLKP